MSSVEYAATTAGGRARQILIVDDEEDITGALKAGLEKKGFVVDIYNDPLEALPRIKPNHYDLAIFDIRMPNMSGFDLYREFKKDHSDTDVCFFTAYDIHEGEYDDMLADVNVRAFLKKPMTIAELASRLDSMLETPSRANTSVVSRLPTI